MKAIICGVSGYLSLISGVVIILGTAGASDSGVVNVSEIIFRVLIGGCLCILGYLLLKLGKGVYKNEQKK